MKPIVSSLSTDTCPGVLLSQDRSPQRVVLRRISAATRPNPTANKVQGNITA